ncbi:MAG: hypothetical protein A4E61_01065 [Syntrophorhabdus sp. PtaB.Bin184]|nr:MAG: hypothetical protein A4E61_01065 [Syntrophorhabdus sp. PtaB.Bin184]
MKGEPHRLHRVLFPLYHLVGPFYAEYLALVWLAEDVLLLDGHGFDGEIDGRAGAIEGYLDGIALSMIYCGGDIEEFLHLLAVDLDDDVTGPYACSLRRGVLGNLADACGGYVIADDGDEIEDEKGKEDIEQGACQGDEYPYVRGFVREGPVFLLFDNLLVGGFAEEFHVTTHGNRGYGVFRIPPGETEKFLSEPYGEGEDLDVEEPRDQEVPEFVHQDEKREGDEKV